MYIIILYLIFYLAYLELSPGLGNIWFRLNADNIRCINIMSAINIILYPLKNLTFWYVQNWDLNFFIYYILIKILSYIYE